VTVVTRSGATIEGVRTARIDATDGDALTAQCRGADTLMNCANPPYGQWQKRWPPLFATILESARRSQTSLVTMGNLYPYGRAQMPMTESTPENPVESKGIVRRDGWALARAAHERGEIRAVEVRASDYFGPGAGATAHLGRAFFEPILAGKTARVIGNPDAPHSWAYIPDIAATIVAAADYDGDWGRIWHVPSATDRSRSEILRDLREQHGAEGRLAGVPAAMLSALAMVSPSMREVRAVSYQLTDPFLATSRLTQDALGVRATDWAAALDATVSASGAFGEHADSRR
jgi:nucleoside-diphosphate-sugar epimerase